MYLGFCENGQKPQGFNFGPFEDNKISMESRWKGEQSNSYLHSLHLLLDGFHGDTVGGGGGESGGAVSRDEARRLAKGWIPIDENYSAKYAGQSFLRAQ